MITLSLLLLLVPTQIILCMRYMSGKSRTSRGKVRVDRYSDGRMLQRVDRYSDGRML